VQKTCKSVKKSATSVKKPATARSGSRSAAQSQSGAKDVNNSLIQRALDLVHEGQLTTSVAIRLFGIPRSTFYKKLSTCSKQTQPTSIPDVQTETQYYQNDGGFQLGFDTEDFGGGTVDGLVGSSQVSSDGTIQAEQWSNYGDYYAT